MYSVLIQQILVDFLPEIDLHPEKWRSVMNMLVTVSGVVGMLWKKGVSNTFWNVVSMYYWELFPTEYCSSYPHSNHVMNHKNTSQGLRYLQTQSVNTVFWWKPNFNFNEVSLSDFSFMINESHRFWSLVFFLLLINIYHIHQFFFFIVWQSLFFGLQMFAFFNHFLIVDIWISLFHAKIILVQIYILIKFANFSIVHIFDNFVNLLFA